MNPGRFTPAAAVWLESGLGYRSACVLPSGGHSVSPTETKDTYDDPSVDVQASPQLFDVLHEVRRGVGRQVGGGVVSQWPAPAAASLVKQHRPVGGRIEETTDAGAGSRPGPAVQIDRWQAVGVPYRLPIDLMLVTHIHSPDA